MISIIYYWLQKSNLLLTVKREFLYWLQNTIKSDSWIICKNRVFNCICKTWRVKWYLLFLFLFSSKKKKENPKVRSCDDWTRWKPYTHAHLETFDFLKSHEVHVRFGCSHLYPMGQLTHTRCSLDGAPDPDGTLKETVRIKIRHYHNVYSNRSDPTVFLSLVVDTSGHLYDDFIRFLSKKSSDIRCYSWP